MLFKYTGVFLICCWVLITGICGMLLYMFFRPTSIESKTFVCGNAWRDKTTGNGSDSAFADGIAVFNSNCASCHHRLKDVTGPALKDIGSYRTQEWICR